MAAANVLPILDTSASMTYSGYVAVTKTDSEAFVRSARPGDRIGVASYDVSGRITYPPGGTALVTVDFSLKQTREAAAAIEALSFEGGATNIGDGIVQARKLMDPAPFPKGLVLLSDGYQNFGTNPLSVLPSYPIYSCAMGPYSDQNLMQQIAAGTNGRYYYAPTVLVMTLIFNAIRGEQPATTVVTNDQALLDSPRAFAVPISGGQDGAQFMVVWNPSDAPAPVVKLLQPDGTPWTAPPDVQDPGFVIWNLGTAPAVGAWQLAVSPNAGAGNAPTVTGGGFEFGEDAAAIALTLTHTLEGAASVRFQADLAENGQPLDGVQVTADVLRPQVGLREALDRFRDDIARLQLEDGQAPSDYPSELQGLRALDRQRGGTLLPVVRERVTFQGKSALLTGTAGESLTVRVVATGTTQRGTTAQRTQVVTIPLFA